MANGLNFRKLLQISTVSFFACDFLRNITTFGDIVIVCACSLNLPELENGAVLLGRSHLAH